MEDPKIAAGVGERAPEIQSRTFEGHTSVASIALFSPDGARVVSSSSDATVRVWDVASRRELARHTLTSGYPIAVDVAPDESYVVVSVASGHPDWTNRMYLIDPRDGHEVRRFEIGLGVYFAVFSPNGRFVATGNAGWRPALSLYEVDSGQALRELEGDGWYAKNPVFSPDGRWVLFARNVSGPGFADSVHLWNAVNGEELRALEGTKGSAFCKAVFSPDGRFVFAGGSKLCLWDFETGKRLWQGRGHKGRRAHPNGIVGVAFARDGARVLVGDQDSVVRVLDVATGEELARHREAFFHRTAGMAFSPDRRHVLSSGHVRSARLWDLP
jgi:WD40 repeat protein